MIRTRRFQQISFIDFLSIYKLIDITTYLSERVFCNTRLFVCVGPAGSKERKMRTKSETEKRNKRMKRPRRTFLRSPGRVFQSSRSFESGTVNKKKKETVFFISSYLKFSFVRAYFLVRA